MPVGLTAETAVPRRSGQDADLACKARELLLANGAGRMAGEVRVEWNTRLKSSAGRADYRRKLILLNPRLHEHGTAEIDRTFRHELAHLLAQFGCALSPPPNRILSAESVPPWRSMNQDSFERKRRTPNAQHRTPN